MKYFFMVLSLVIFGTLCFMLGLQASDYMLSLNASSPKFKVEDNFLGSTTLVQYETYKIKKIKVKSGYSFDIMLFGGYDNQNVGPYKMKLYGVKDAPLESKKEVLRYLNNAQESGAYLYFMPHSYNSVEELWEGDILANTDSIKEWLSQKNLLYLR